MDELVSVVSEETGLPEAQARKAAEAVVKFLKDKLPEPLAGQLDNVLEGSAAADGAEQLLKLGKGLLGKK